MPENYYEKKRPRHKLKRILQIIGLVVLFPVLASIILLYLQLRPTLRIQAGYDFISAAAKGDNQRFERLLSSELRERLSTDCSEPILVDCMSEYIDRDWGDLENSFLKLVRQVEMHSFITLLGVV